MPAFRHLTYSDRLKIEALYKAGHTKSDISRQLGYSHQAIGKEIKRGLVDQISKELILYKTYSADVAQSDHDYKTTAKGAPVKIGKDYQLLNYIETKIIEEKYSPAAVVESIRINNLEFETSISKATIYNYIDSGLFFTLKRKHLLYGGRPRRKKQKKRKPAQHMHMY